MQHLHPTFMIFLERLGHFKGGLGPELTSPEVSFHSGVSVLLGSRWIKPDLCNWLNPEHPNHFSHPGNSSVVSQYHPFK